MTGARTFLGIEQEFEVFVSGRKRDFRSLFAGVTRGVAGFPFRNRRDAAINAVGYVIACDGAEAEYATVPVSLTHEGCAVASREAVRCREHLLDVLRLAGVEQQRGFSTHLNVSLDPGEGWDFTWRAAQSLGPAIILLTQGRLSPGLLFRPRPQRFELGTAYVDDPDVLTTSLALIAGGLRLLRRPHRGGLPIFQVKRWVPGVSRPGYILLRDAYGACIQTERGAAPLLTTDGEQITAADALRLCADLALSALGEEVDATVREIVNRTVELHATLSSPRVPVDHAVKRYKPSKQRALLASAFAEVVTRAPRLGLNPRFIDWEGCAFDWHQRNQQWVMAAPPSRLGAMMDRVEEGSARDDLTDVLPQHLSRLTQIHQLSSPGLFNGIDAVNLGIEAQGGKKKKKKKKKKTGGMVKCTVTLSGPDCLCVGATKTYSAAGDPPGGTYEWDPPSDPAVVRQVATNNTANVTGLDRGRATIKVKYTTPAGHQCTATKMVQVVKLRPITATRRRGCTGVDFTFSITTDPAGCESGVQWTGGGTPATGTGASFTTKFNTGGAHAVRARCGSQIQTFTVMVVQITFPENPFLMCSATRITFGPSTPSPIPGSAPTPGPISIDEAELPVIIVPASEAANVRFRSTVRRLATPRPPLLPAPAGGGHLLLPLDGPDMFTRPPRHGTLKIKAYLDVVSGQPCAEVDVKVVQTQMKAQVRRFGQTGFVDLGANNTICFKDTLRLSVEVLPVGTSGLRFQWYRKTGGTDHSGPTSQRWTLTNLAAGEHEIRLELTLPSGQHCAGNTKNILVVDVAITSPKGSLSQTSVPANSWLSSSPYRFDFQGVKRGVAGAYVLNILGRVQPTPPAQPLWTLAAAAGTLTNTSTLTPIHTAPASAGEGDLILKAQKNGRDTGCEARRRVKIYQDHLARDQDNFGSGTPCAGPWSFTKYGRTITIAGRWNCHGSTQHAYDGSGTGSTSAIGFVGTLKKTVRVTHRAGGGGTHPPLGTLNRGDIVAYYGANGHLMHSQTCTGNGTQTYGANNVPLAYPGHARNQAWRWSYSTAGDWANKLWEGAWSAPGGFEPVEIRVYNKP